MTSAEAIQEAAKALNLESGVPEPTPGERCGGVYVQVGTPDFVIQYLRDGCMTVMCKGVEAVEAAATAARDIQTYVSKRAGALN